MCHHDQSTTVACHHWPFFLYIFFFFFCHFFHPPPFFVRSGDSLKQLPGFYALMTRRRSEDYERMLREVVKLTNLQAQQCMTLLPHENMGPAFYALKAECDLGSKPASCGRHELCRTHVDWHQCNLVTKVLVCKQKNHTHK